MITTDSPIYRKAFEHYLRRGTPLEVSLARMAQKVEATDHHSTPLYIWHTAGDNKVRPTHAANAGKVFAWVHPPDTGNPGEAINCRCWAEPVEVDTTPLDMLALLAGGGLVLRAGRVVISRVGGAIVRRVIGREVPRSNPSTKPEPRLDDTKTWPKPPREGKYREGNPSRNKPRSRGEKVCTMRRVESGGIRPKVNIMTKYIGIISQQAKRKNGRILVLMVRSFQNRGFLNAEY